MKACLLVLNLLLLQTTLLAQPTIQWQKTFGGNDFDEPTCVKQTSDGGFIVVGNSLSYNGDVNGNHGDNDYWVIKLNESGSVEWKKAYGGEDTDWPRSVQQTPDGGYIIAGLTYSNDGDVTGNHGDKDAWIVKLSAAGTIQWQKTYGGSGREEAFDIQLTSDGGYIFAGSASSSNGDVSGVHGDEDYWVVKLDVQGGIQWQKTFGGSSQDNARAVTLTSDGGYVITGQAFSSDGDVTDNKGDMDYWIIKLTNTGILSWQKAFGGNNTDSAYDIHQTSDGGYIIAGHTVSNNNGDVTGFHGLFDIWITKLSNAGELVWQKALGGSQPDLCYSISPTNDGMFVILGGTQSTNGDVLGNDGGADFWLVKLDGNGDIIWQNTLGGTKAEAGYHIEQTNDNGFILCGLTWSSNTGDLTGSTNHGQNDFWVVKLAPETVGTNETPQPSAGQLELFPNPTQQAITLKASSEATELAVVLTDVLGRRVLEKTIPNGGAMQIGSLPDGVYWVQATDERGSGYSARLRKKA